MTSVIGMIVYLAYHINEDPNVIKEYSDISKQGYEDLVSWGRLKIGVDKEEVVVKNAIKYSELLEDNETEEDQAQTQRPEDNDANNGKAEEEEINTQENDEDV